MYVNHQVVLEYDPETKSYTATVPGLPIVVDADSEEEALRLAKEGISVCLKEASSRKRTEKREKPVQVKIVTVEVQTVRLCLRRATPSIEPWSRL